MSELLGKGTIDKKSSGETKGRQGSSSRNYDVLGREIFTPDEVRKLDNKKCIIFIRCFDPILDNKYVPFHHPMFNQTADGKEQKVMHYLKSHESISTQEVMILCEYKTRAGARRLLDKMIQNAILRKIGSGPGTKYVLNEVK